MSVKQDVLIIGGGIIGVCTAYFAAKSGLSVTVVEKHALGSGCSQGNAGWLVPSHSAPLAAPGMLQKSLKLMLSGDSPVRICPRLSWELFRWLLSFAAACREDSMHAAIPLLRDLNRASLDLYVELNSRRGVDFGFRQTGALMVFKTARNFSDGRRDAANLDAVGIESQVLSGEAVHTMEPSITPAVAGGIFYPGDAHIRPTDVVNKLAALALNSGCRFMTSTRVMGFDTFARKVIVVRTTQGDFRPETVVLAAGAESSEIVRGLKIRLPVQAAKGYSFSVPTEVLMPRRPLLLSDAKIAVTPFGDRTRVAGNFELSGLDYNLDRNRLEVVRRNAARYLAAQMSPIAEEWSGLRPCTPDGLPIIGRSSGYENVIVATGHGMLGVSLGPITGKLVAQLASGTRPDLDISALSVSRFARSKTLIRQPLWGY